MTQAGIQVLKDAVVFLAQYPDAYVMCLGDYNMLLDPTLDRHGGVTPKRASRANTLKRLMLEIGWTDLWRTRNPQTRA